MRRHGYVYTHTLNEKEKRTMKKTSKRVLAMLMAVVMLLALAACGGGNDGGGTQQTPSGGSSETQEPAASSGSKELTVYTAFPEAEVVYYFNEFEKETGIKVNYIRLSAGEMLTRVEAPGIPSMWAASPSPATRSGLPTRACPIPPAGRSSSSPSSRVRSSWPTPPPPVPPTPFWPPWFSSRATTRSGNTWAS